LIVNVCPNCGAALLMPFNEGLVGAYRSISCYKCSAELVYNNVGPEVEQKVWLKEDFMARLKKVGDEQC